MKTNNPLTIAALPKDEHFWRIDWFGEMRFPNRALRHTQPSLLDHLSRLQDESFQDDPSVLLKSNSTFPAKFQRKVWLSVGTLAILRIGDIWQAGRLAATPDYQIEQFYDVPINENSTSLIKAGLNLDEEGFLLPMAEHPWRMQCTQSYCMMVALPENRRLIIPCIELIRFYFGSSSSLLSKLFVPPLERKTLYSKGHFDRFSGRLTLDLADKISSSSAADIGRLHLDKQAWLAALHIGASALKASLSEPAVYPQALFPFEGKTNLVASGKWLAFGDQPKATFIVYNLRSCDHPFPFKSLHYKLPANSSTPTKAGENPGRATTPIRKAARDASDQPLTEQDASQRLSSQIKQVSFPQRFPDLRNKTVWKKKVLSKEKTNATVIPSSAAPIEQAALDQPSSAQRIRPVNLEVILAREPDKQRPPPPFLADSVAQLSRLRGFDVELLTESEEDGWTVPINLLPDDDGEIDMRMFADLATLRARRVAVFAVRKDGEQVSIVVVESDPLYLRLYTTVGNSEDEIYQTLMCTAKDYLLRAEPELAGIMELLQWVFDIDD